MPVLAFPYSPPYSFLYEDVRKEMHGMMVVVKGEEEVMLNIVSEDYQVKQVPVDSK